MPDNFEQQLLAMLADSFMKGQQRHNPINPAAQIAVQARPTVLQRILQMKSAQQQPDPLAMPMMPPQSPIK